MNKLKQCLTYLYDKNNMEHIKSILSHGTEKRIY